MLIPRMISQRRAPLISAPKNKVAITITKLTANTTSAMRRIWRGVSINVPVDEIKRIKAEPRRHRRARGQREHDAGNHHHQQGGEHQLVHGSPPGGESEAAAARNHSGPRCVAGTSRQRTMSRCAAPRTPCIHYGSQTLNKK